MKKALITDVAGHNRVEPGGVRTDTFYYASSVELDRGKSVKPYGRGDNFRALFDFCTSLVEKNPDKIPFLRTFEEFMKVKGIRFPNRYSLGSILREVLAEQVRRAHFPERPSRVGSVFVFINYADAYRFLIDYRKGRGGVYRCESAARKMFTGDMDIISYARLPQKDYQTGFQVYKDSMIRYWEGKEPMKYPETICSDSVTIIEPVYLADKCK